MHGEARQARTQERAEDELHSLLVGVNHHGGHLILTILTNKMKFFVRCLSLTILAFATSSISNAAQCLETYSVQERP